MQVEPLFSTPPPPPLLTEVLPGPNGVSIGEMARDSLHMLWGALLSMTDDFPRPLGTEHCLLQRTVSEGDPAAAWPPGGPLSH